MCSSDLELLGNHELQDMDVLRKVGNRAYYDKEICNGSHDLGQETFMTPAYLRSTMAWAELSCAVTSWQKEHSLIIQLDLPGVTYGSRYIVYARM